MALSRGVYLFQAAQAGTFGVIAFVVILLGTSLASWIFSSDVTFVPVIAAESSWLCEQIYSTSHIVIGMVGVLSWVLGLEGISQIWLGYAVLRNLNS